MKYLLVGLLTITLTSYANQNDDESLFKQCDLPSKSVILFTAPWCSTCKAFKAKLNEIHVDFYEINAEASAKNEAAFDCVGGQYYPYVLVKGEVIPFDPEALEQAFLPLVK